MHPRSFPPLVEAFLIIEQPRQRLSHWLTTLSVLDSDKAPPLATITAFWDPFSDQALLGLRYDELALGPSKLDLVVETALLAEIGMIQPLELAEGERRRFLSERLARCPIQVTDQRTVTGALTELARRIRDHKKSGSGSEPPRNTSTRARTGTDENPVLLIHAKGTRNDMDRTRAAHSQAGPLPKPDLSAPRMPSPNVVSRHHRAETVEVPSTELDAMVRSAMAATRPQSAVAASAGVAQVARSERSQPITGPMPSNVIYARYLRSGRWVPVRIGALSLKGAALLAGALPRVNDHVDIALTFGDHRALVRGPVSKVSTVQEAQTSGTATFSVSFELDDASRRQLTGLLTAARDAKVVIKPPPSRSNCRFTVEWPICLGSNRGAMRANALDVSREGMFVRPQNPLLLDADMMFSAALDDDHAPVSGRAKVVRHVTEADARACGLVPGWGLKLIELGDDDRARWDAFLGRVEKRSDKRVLIGASPARLAELHAGLTAAGYVVTGGTDPGAVVQLASAESRQVDAALIDGGWLAPGTPAQWIESLFSARNVPCVTVHDTDARIVRATIDRVLSVA